MLYFFQPQQIDGSLGKGYNHYMSLLPNDDDWAVLMDYDTMFLYHPEEIIKKAIAEYPDTDVFTCFTNRIGKRCQLATGVISNERNILSHYDTAIQVHNAALWKSTRLREPISGFCMIVKKSAWLKVPFDEQKRYLGVDDDFSKNILRKGLVIRRIDGLYMFHFYRMHKSNKDTTHLR